MPSNSPDQSWKEKAKPSLPVWGLRSPQGQERSILFGLCTTVVTLSYGLWCQITETPIANDDSIAEKPSDIPTPSDANLIASGSLQEPFDRFAFATKDSKLEPKSEPEPTTEPEPTLETDNKSDSPEQGFVKPEIESPNTASLTETEPVKLPEPEPIVFEGKSRVTKLST